MATQLNPAGALSLDFVQEAQETFNSDPKNILARNAVTSTAWGTVVINRDEFQKMNHSFSVKLNDMKVTNQKRSGRCWIFAATTIFRRAMQKEYKLGDDFELSQSYLFFFDKLERCNYFLENVISTSDEPVDGRLVQHLLTDLISDGGQWDMICNLVEKYGVVPKSVYPDAEAATASYPMNKFLKAKLREFARTLRSMHQSGKSEAQIRMEKDKMMHVIHRILVIHLGTPPTTFDWTVHDKDKKFVSFRGLSPLQFYKEYVKVDVNELVSIVNDPRHQHCQAMTVDRLGNVVGGRPVLYVNASVEDLCKYAKKTLDDGEPVWFGCDVGKDSSLKANGIMSTSFYNYDLVFGTKPAMSKKDRLIHRESEMTHAMVFTGYDEDVNNPAFPRMWRVENSWGDEAGDKGYDIMTGEWFKEHMYQVVVDKKYLSKEHLDALKQEPIVLPPWDPMGSLA